MVTPRKRRAASAKAGYWRGLLLLAATFISLTGCSGSTRQLKIDIVGNWDEVHGTKETLQFNNDGTLIMNSPREHHDCTYEFPDTDHIRLNCASPGTSPFPTVYKMTLKGDDLTISDNSDTGKYQRRYTSQP